MPDAFKDTKSAEHQSLTDRVDRKRAVDWCVTTRVLERIYVRAVESKVFINGFNDSFGSVLRSNRLHPRLVDFETFPILHLAHHRT